MFVAFGWVSRSVEGRGGTRGRSRMGRFLLKWIELFGKVKNAGTKTGCILTVWRAGILSEAMILCTL